MQPTPKLGPVTRRTAVILIAIVVTGVLGRMYHLQSPLSGYRPNDTAAIARNFYEHGMRILYPQIDWRGNSTGYVESEFQLYSFTAASLYQMFGEHDVIGRGLSIVAYALSALLLFALVRRLADEATGLLAAFFYSMATIAFYYTRSFQPDATLALGSLAGIYYFWKWTEERSLLALAVSAAGVCIAVLIKPTNLYLGLPLLYLAYRAFGLGFLRRVEIWIFALAVTVPAALWYRHAYQFWVHDGNTFGVFGGWVKYKAFPPDRSLAWDAAKAIVKRVFVLMATPAGCLLLLVGLLKRPASRNFVLHWWCVGFGVAAVVAAKGMEAHDYYQLPMVFFVAAWMALGTMALWNAEFLPRKLLRAAVVVIGASVLGYSLWRWEIKLTQWEVGTQPKELDRVEFAQRVSQLTEPDAMIIMVRPYRGVPSLYQHRTAQGEHLECDPVDFYRSHRIGWSLDDRLARLAFIDTLRGRGARYFATAFPELLALHPELKTGLDSLYTPLEVNEHWAIYRLERLPVRAGS